jgi:large subunit ribosomal protein L10
MSKPVKNMLTSYLRDRFAGVNSACVVDLTKLNVQSTEQIRKSLREANGRLEVVRNSLARRAFMDTPLQPLGDALKGPSALVVGDSVVDLAKKLTSLTREFAELKLKEAIFEGDSQLLTVELLSKMKSRVELLGDVAALISGPGRRLAGAIGSPQAKIAGCLKAIADKE